MPSVVYIEGPYALSLDLDVAVPEARATTVHNAPGVGTPPTTYRGRNVIVGIIDSGIDYTHPAFRNADGTTRILSIWDQGPVPVPPPPVGAAPAGFGYGREYDMTAINTALGNANPLSVVPHQDGSAVGHGTHVAGIAAGNGRPVSYTHLRAHETVLDLVCRLLLEKKKNTTTNTDITVYTINNQVISKIP